MWHTVCEHVHVHVYIVEILAIEGVIFYDHTVSQHVITSDPIMSTQCCINRLIKGPLIYSVYVNGTCTHMYMYIHMAFTCIHVHVHVAVTRRKLIFSRL